MVNHTDIVEIVEEPEVVPIPVIDNVTFDNSTDPKHPENVTVPIEPDDDEEMA